MKKKWLLILMLFISSGGLFLFGVMQPEPLPLLKTSWQKTGAEVNRDRFVFVIDHSLSLKENQMEQVIRGYQRMIADMPAGASAAIVIFGNTVEVIQTMVHDHSRLIGRLNGIRPDGLSMFYDGLAMGIGLLREYAGRKTIVFFTDGTDDSSTCSLEQIQKMAIVEGIRVYGAGIGDLDKERLKEFSAATGGFFGTAPTYKSLSQVYPFIMTHYKEEIKKRAGLSGELIVNSFPDGKKVFVDGNDSGLTPLRIAGIPAGSHQVSVSFKSGTTTDMISVAAGKWTRADFRATSKGRNLVIASTPGNAAVFIDGAYVGFTGDYSNDFNRDTWKTALTGNAGKRVVPNLPFGQHTIVFPGKPELNPGIGVKQDARINVDLTRTAEDAALVTMLFNKTVLRTNLKKVTAVNSH